MLIGNKMTFAIQSEVSKFLESESQLAIGLFNIHIKANRYGVAKPDASLLGNSFKEVQLRIKRREKHTIKNEISAIDLVSIIQYETYGLGKIDLKFGENFRKQIMRDVDDNLLIWAPDGDEAFDDGSHVIHIDSKDKVRIIGFLNEEPVAKLSEIYLEASVFYEVLSTWYAVFFDDWKRSPLKET
ncbi:Imm42 family immunity protein [Xaviernesmea oryzae]|uniref:Imm42 family immunity protein n=1 Tax=Xaviernesmea oryzae TaxID=464029 RepID=UPI0008C5C129|nr:Imm42 family immunity protein [Xaviernesmea oryzae]SEM35475.1 Immunity protein 42 [Xaviernesmea oryzae]